MPTPTRSRFQVVVPPPLKNQMKDIAHRRQMTLAGLVELLLSEGVDHTRPRKRKKKRRDPVNNQKDPPRLIAEAIRF